MADIYYRLPLDLEGIVARQQLPRCSAQESIAQHLYLLLTTHFGESRYDAGFGCQVWEQDFEAMTTMRWKDSVQQSVEEAIRTYEPRLVRARAQIAITDFELKNVSQRIRKRLDVSITAVLHRTNEPFAFQASLFVAPSRSIKLVPHFSGGRVVAAAYFFFAVLLPPRPPATPATDFSKASVKSRLTRQAAELWGYGEADLDGFDPLVNLLLEACAVEFEKMGQELHSTQSRLVERLATLLNPDVVDTPMPAHAVAQARARETTVALPADAQFVFETPVVGRQATGPALYFSPLQATRLVGGSVRCLATDTTVWQLDAQGQKQVVAQVASPAPAAHRRLWVGLALPATGLSLDDLTFYFDWLNEPRKDTYAAFLPGEQWLLGGVELTPLPGAALAATHLDESPGLLNGEYDYLRRIEERVRDLYAPSFVQLAGPAGALATYVPRPYPAELAAAFANPATDLQALTEPLVWLEIRFAHALPPEAFQQLICALNCFPVLNRRLYKVLFRLQPALNLFPLASEEPFLAVRDVYSLSNVAYRSTTLSDLSEGATDTYTLRSHGVGRFDTRTGREALRELLELLRDESRAFTAAGTDFIGTILRELDQNLARLEERLDRRAAAEQPVPYLLLRPQDVNDSVYLEYWASNGEAANRLPAGSRLRIHNGLYLDEVRLLTSTSGGRERPRPEERTHALRRNLLARNRLVTLADIRAACWAELGLHLGAVHVEKGFQTSPTPAAGFVRCIRVQLTPLPSSRLSALEWERAAHQLQATLSGQSAVNLPYEVVMQQVGA